jgi:putative transposase
MRPPFVPFDRNKAVRVYRRHLPHWRQEGATYFVTFRLNDAIPQEARQRLEHEESTWLQARGIDASLDRRSAYEQLSKPDRYQFRRHLNRLREEVHDTGYGECWLNQPEVVAQMRTQILTDDDDVLHIGDFVIMSNHVHLLIAPSGRELEDCMKRIKGSSATLCNRILSRTGTFWQADTFDHIVRNIDQLQRYREYIADNPNKARIHVPEAGYYRADWL